MAVTPRGLRWFRQSTGLRSRGTPSPRSRSRPSGGSVRVLERFALDGRKAVVTGGNQGLGKAFAAALAEAGADVMIVARDTGRNAAAAAEVKAGGLSVSAPAAGS